MVESRRKISHPNQKTLTGDEKPALCVKSGAEGDRTPDPLHAMQVRSQLRHSPIYFFISSKKN